MGRVSWRRVLLALAVGLAPIPVAACARATSPSVGQPPPTPAALEQPALAQMEPSAKRSEIASSFPVQVPVPNATVVAGAETSPRAAWVYELETTAAPAALADWYRRMYAAADWTATRDSSSGPAEAPVIDLAFSKNAASSTVRIERAAGRTAASVSVGLGTAPPVVY